jgi:hydrogenase maturation protein HypF
MLTKGTSCVPTSSAGRLFDAASSLLGICHEVQYEGQAAIELEAVALASEPVVLPEPAIIDAGEGWQLDSSPLIRGLVEALRAGHPVAGIAHGFHQALAAGLTRCAVLVREQTGVTTAGLTGGVFANRVLTSYLQGNLVQEGFGVLTHRVVPPNDGGLALGQVAVAAGGGALRWRSG